MDISKNLVILFVIGQVLLIIWFVLNLNISFHALNTNGMATVEGAYLAVVVFILFIKSYIQTDQSYFNGKKENQRKYD